VRELIAAMCAAGLEPVKLPELYDGQLVRFRVAGDKSGSRNGWVVLHRHPEPVGIFGSWKTGESHAWRMTSDRPMSPEDRARQRAQILQAQKVRAEAESQMRADSKARAERLWNVARPASNDHPYLKAKQVPAYGLRLLRESLVIPLRSADGELHTLQFIGPDGEKRFLTGGRVVGCYFAIGRPSDSLLLAEGYATAATLFAATGMATAACFNCGNLEPVARALRAKFPRLRLVVVADNDAFTEGNPGLTKARAAARAVGGFLAVPQFKGGHRG